MNGDKANLGAGKPELVDVDGLRKAVEIQKDAVYDWTYANGRRYASTKLGHYYMPNDQPEIQRLNDQHWILTQLKGGALHIAPLPKDDGLRVLDIGCGSGIWCIQMSEDYPTSSITGMDVSPIQPENKPANVEWTIHDVETDWPFPDNHFDFIHLSLVHGCVTDWGVMMDKIVRHLAPGGYVEHQEYSLGRQYTVGADNHPVPLPDNIDDYPPLLRWSRLMEQAADRRGRTIQLGPKLVTFQSSAGLKDVTEKVYHIKVGTWSSDEQERTIGARVMLNAMQGMDGFTTVLFTKALGWKEEDVGTFVGKVKTNLRDDSMRKIMDFHVVYGRKAGSGSVEFR